MKKIHLIISFVSCSIIGVFWFLLALLARIDPPELLETIIIDIVIGGIIAFAVFCLVQLVLFTKPKKIKIGIIFGIIFWIVTAFPLMFWHCRQLRIRYETWQKAFMEAARDVLTEYWKLQSLSYHGIRPTEAQIKEEGKQWESILADISAHEHAIIDILKNGNLDFRKIAACALAEIKSGMAVTTLNEILGNAKEDIALRRLTAYSLGRIGGQKAIETLKRALKDPSVSLGAACALADFGDPAAIEPLLNGLRKSEYNTDSFYTAVAGLEKIKDLRSIELLITILKDCNHEYSRNTIAHALYNIITKRFGRDDIKWLEFTDNYAKWQEWWGQNKKDLNNAK